MDIKQDVALACHHKIPIAQGVRITHPIEDCTLVCSNCHHVVEWLKCTPDHLRDILSKKEEEDDEARKHIP